MARHLRVQHVGEACARVLATKDIALHIPDGVLVLRLQTLQPGGRIDRALTIYESADCPHCLGEGSFFDAESDRNISCEPCGESGITGFCSSCGDQIPPDDELCEGCRCDAEQNDEAAHRRAHGASL